MSTHISTATQRLVSTHSRLKAAGLAGIAVGLRLSNVSTHSRLKAAGR